MAAVQLRSNPFPGLRPFESHEDHLFFGRNGQSNEILKRLSRNRFLAVVGTSGSGKSSLIRAGLLPLLHGGFMTTAGSRWRIALFRPGNAPIANLALTLAAPDVFGAADEDGETEAIITEATLRRSGLGIIDAVRQAKMPLRENLLIVVDQFEELFRFKQNTINEYPEDEAAAFVKLLLEATQQSELPIYVVITMRSDFIGDCAQFRNLPEAVNEGLYLIPRMTRAQRREAITGPVAVGGGEISQRLVNRLLNDVGDNLDELPILQHALLRAWDYWIKDHKAKEPLDLRHYEEIGGMDEALSRHADKAYNELLDDRSKEVAEKLFKALTEKGPDNREVRRPAKVSEICAIAEAEEAEVIAVIESFRRSGRSFLMPPSKVALNAESLIDISHESLIRGWKRLREWVEGEALSARIYRRVAETSVLYRDGKAGLWRDPDLQVALGWRDKVKPNRAWAVLYHPEFDAAMSFLDASQAARDAEAIERDRQRRRELRRTRVTAIVFGLLFLAASAMSMYALTLRGVAERERQNAEQKAIEAETAQRTAEDQRQKAQESEEATKSALAQARNAERKASENATRAEAALKAAKEQKRIAQQKQEVAERLTQDLKLEALRTREQTLDLYSSMQGWATKLIELAPSATEKAAWHTLKAQALSYLGNKEESIKEYTQALKDNPGQLDALAGRSYTYLISNREKESVDDSKLYTQDDPNNPSNNQNLGLGLALLGDYKGARSAMQQSIQLLHQYDMYSFTSFYETSIAPEIKKETNRNLLRADGEAALTSNYYELVNIEAAVGGDFEAALETANQRPTSADAYLFALNWAAMHLKRRPEDYGAFVAKGALWERVGKKDQAILSYRKFQEEYKKHSAEARYSRLAKWVDKRMAMQDNMVIKVPSEDQEIRALAIEIKELEASGKLDEAYNLLTESINKYPGNPLLLTQRAWLLMLQGKYGESMKDLDVILKLTPHSSVAYLARGSSDPISENRIANYRKALEYNPASVAALNYLSNELVQSNPEEALKLIERSIRFNKLDPEPYFRKAVLQNKIGRYADAFKSITAAIALKGDQLVYYDEREKAERGFGKKSEVEIKRKQAAGYSDAASINLRQSKTSEAISTYLKSLEILDGLAKDKSRAEVLGDLSATVFRISNILEDLGSKEKAIEFWQALIESGQFKSSEEVLKNEIRRLSPSSE